MQRAAKIIGLIFGFYFVVRAILEPFLIDMTDPAAYRHDWGGPSLFGVLLVHCGPGVVSAVLIIWAFLRRRSSKRSRRADISQAGS